MITVANIVNACPGRLLCITYEILLDHIKKAAESEAENKNYHLAKANEAIKLLTSTLDFKISLSNELFRIYVYVQSLLVSNTKKEKLEEAYRLIDKLYKAYDQITEDENGMPSMQNAEAIYAGVTYGTSDVNEIYLGSTNRGFKA